MSEATTQPPSVDALVADNKRLRLAVMELADACRATLVDDLAWIGSDSELRLKKAVELATTVLEHGAVKA